MTAVLIFLALLVLWAASFSLDRAEKGTSPKPTGRRLPLTAFIPAREPAAEDPPAPVELPQEEAKEKPAPFEPFWYVVEPGDTLEGISFRFYKKRSLWRRIHRANLLAVPDPDSLDVGARILIPPPTGEVVTAEEFASPTWSRAPAGTSLSKSGPRSLEYIVQPGNTLWGIAEMLYGSSDEWKRIYQLNMGVIDDPHKLKPGTRLYVP